MDDFRPCRTFTGGIFEVSEGSEISRFSIAWSIIAMDETPFEIDFSAVFCFGSKFLLALEELHKIAPHVNRWAIYKRAIRIGKEHIGALVGTLAIAYVGVALPLILLYTKTGFPLLVTINQEIFATEIVRILVSSIGLILAVPITTILAIYIIVKNRGGEVSEEMMEQEKEKLEHANHSH